MVMRDVIRNRERQEDYDVHWNDPDPDLGRITAVLRVKNESRSLPWVLPGLFRVVDRIVLVDNGSDDGTPDVARSVAEQQGAADRIEVFDYPFSVARCGPEHLSVPPDSLHSLTYFYNWAFSHVKTAYCMKWDGDMVLTEDGETYLKHLRWQLEGVDTIVQIPRYAVYVESPDVAYVDAGLAAVEAWLWPNKPAYHFGKAFEWEILVRPQSTPVLRLPEWTVFELKWLDADEFTNWSTIDPKTTIRTGRKNRDWTIFHAVKEGEVPEDVHRVDSPGDRHVIDVLREPASARFVTESYSTETTPLIP
jgi:hypothetical protein